MNKRIVVRVFNAICLLSGVFLLITLPLVMIAGQYWKATRPCFFQYLIGLVPIVCSIIIFILSALPGKLKVTSKHLNIEKFVESLLILAFCFAALDFFFEFRIEYFGAFGLLSSDMEKFLTLMFYVLLLMFFKTKHYYVRVAAVIVGVINIIYIPVFRNLYYPKPFNLSEIEFMMPFVVWILALYLFSSLERAVFSGIPKSNISTEAYYIGRFFDSEGKCYALLHSKDLIAMFLYSFETGEKQEVNSFTSLPDIFQSASDDIRFYSELRELELEEFKNEKDLA